MILFLLSYLGGVLTILSPCILPVLPFVFARSDQPFARSGLPLLLGMALTFAAIASIATLGGSWAVHANQYGRIAAMVLLTLFGLTLLLPSLADRLTRPLVALGSRLSNQANDAESGSIGASLLLGVATGLLWAPCAGPILGLILTGAAINGASANTTLLLLAYAAGAATSLGAALLIGGRLFAAMKNSLGAGEWIRCGLGVLVLAGVVAIALGLDTGFLTKLSQTSTAGLEQTLQDRLGFGRKTQSVAVAGSSLPVEGMMPPLDGAVLWAEFAATDARTAARQGRGGRFLDLFLHQLPACAALCRSLGEEICGAGPGGDRRACAGIRLRETGSQCAPGHARPGRHLSGGAG